MSLNGEESQPQEARRAERESVRQQEARELPEDPSKMTFRGRYDALDRKTFELAGLDRAPKDRPVRILDFAGGVMAFGSPTAHDLVDKVEASDHKAEVDVVDTSIPDELKPNYPEVQYHPSMDDVDGEFDIVRMLHLVEHVRKEEYDRIREQLVNRVREGGLFIATQYFDKKFSRDPERSSGPLPATHKIMQKREGKLVPIELFPDSPPPGPDHQHENFLEAYKQFREDVRVGKATVTTELATDGLQRVEDWINADNRPWKQVLQEEKAEVWTGNAHGDIRKTLAKNAEGTDGRFIEFDKIDLEKAEPKARKKFWHRLLGRKN